MLSHHLANQSNMMAEKAVSETKSKMGKPGKSDKKHPVQRGICHLKIKIPYSSG